MSPLPTAEASEAIQLSTDLWLGRLQRDDAQDLARYFDNLSPASRSRFQPHPLTQAHAEIICQRSGPQVRRFVIRSTRAIVAYFILDGSMSDHERLRYTEHGIELSTDLDILFAPSVADSHQGQGLASLAMPHLVAEAMNAGARSLVLMGGVQATNALAVAFYEKWGFVRHGGYQTSVYNHDMQLVFDKCVGSPVPLTRSPGARGSSGTATD